MRTTAGLFVLLTLAYAAIGMALLWVSVYLLERDDDPPLESGVMAFIVAFWPALVVWFVGEGIIGWIVDSARGAGERARRTAKEKTP